MRLANILLALALLLSGCAGDTDDEPGQDTGADDTADGDADGGDQGTDSDEDDGGDPGDGGDGGEEPPEENSTEEPRDPKTWTISISGNDFVDGSITILVGDTVEWIHEDGTTPHTVTADDGEFDSGTSPADYMTETANSEFEHTFDTAGEFPYFCDVHASMTDAITVQAA